MFAVTMLSRRPALRDGNPVLTLQVERLGEHVAADDGIEALGIAAIAMHPRTQLLERVDAVLLLERVHASEMGSGE